MSRPASKAGAGPFRAARSSCCRRRSISIPVSRAGSPSASSASTPQRSSTRSSSKCRRARHARRPVPDDVRRNGRAHRPGRARRAAGRPAAAGPEQPGRSAAGLRQYSPGRLAGLCRRGLQCATRHHGQVRLRCAQAFRVSLPGDHLDGALDGEFVTQIRFNGINQGSGTKHSWLVRPFLKLPIIFNVRIEAPFRKLLGIYANLNDPTELIRQEVEKQRAAKANSALAVQPADSDNKTEGNVK